MTEMKDVPGFPGYCADLNGNIYSLRRTGVPKVMRPQINGSRMPTLKVTDFQGRTLTRPVNQLLASTYLEEPKEPGYRLWHRNGQWDDCSVQNLIYKKIV
jgi:hypothetical protein